MNNAHPYAAHVVQTGMLSDLVGVLPRGLC
jgi:hypothetical protein